MAEESKIEKPESTGFYKQLLKKVLLTASVVLALSLSYTLWADLDSDNQFLALIIVGMALVKTVFIVRLTFIQLSKIIGKSSAYTRSNIICCVNYFDCSFVFSRLPSIIYFKFRKF